jgi:putative transposase
MIEPRYPELSICEQCELLALPRSTYYYEALPESQENLKLMRVMDELHLLRPFFGSRQMTLSLQRKGYEVNRKRIQRLMRLMDIEAIYPKPRTTIAREDHRVFPYLLKDVAVVRPNQVWCADITYIPMESGFLYLIAIMDWFSRYVLAWELSNSLEVEFCLGALERALKRYGCPDIFNTDQGAQFTSDGFVGLLLGKKIHVSMDGRGRAFDNIFIERLWRTVKYEEVYLNAYSDGFEARKGLGIYFPFYNTKRPHSAHQGQTPKEVYVVR